MVFKNSYALQAGREIRIMVQPEKLSDDDVTILAHKVREKLKTIWIIQVILKLQSFVNFVRLIMLNEKSRGRNKMFRPFIVQWFPFNTAVGRKSLSNSMKESLCQYPINFAKVRR